MCEEESIWFGAHRRLVGWYLVCFAQIISDRSHIANMPALYFVSKLNCVFSCMLLYGRPNWFMYVSARWFCIYYYVFEMVLLCLQLYLICTEPCCALVLSPFLPIICILWQLVNTPSFVSLPTITIVSKLKQAQNAFGGLIIILIVLPIMSVVIIIIKDRGLRRVDWIPELWPCRELGAHQTIPISVLLILVISIPALSSP